MKKWGVTMGLVIKVINMLMMSLSYIYWERQRR